MIRGRWFCRRFLAGILCATLGFAPTAAGHVDFVSDNIQFDEINLALTDRIKVIVKSRVKNECSIMSTSLKDKIEAIFRDNGFTISDEFSTPYLIQILAFRTESEMDVEKGCAVSIETYFKTSIAALLPYQYELFPNNRPDRSVNKASMTVYRYGGNTERFVVRNSEYPRHLEERLISITSAEIANIFHARDRVFTDMPWLKRNYNEFWDFDPID